MTEKEALEEKAAEASVLAQTDAGPLAGETAKKPGPPPGKIDPRGPRFGAVITSVLLAATLVLGPAWGWPVLVVQTLAFALGAVRGLRFQPWGAIFAALIRPKLGPPAEFEDQAPPRFAQGVGLAFGALGLLGVVSGWPVLFYVATAFALAAALLNAVFDFCLGCELYLLGRRLLRKKK